MSRPQLGVKVLGMVADILCGDGNTTALKKFARTVTNKWVLYLLAEDDPQVVTLGLQIMARLIVVHGESYVRKFGNKSGGFVIMKLHLQGWWHLPKIWPLLLAILFGVDVATIDSSRPLRVPDLLEMMSASGEPKLTHPDVLPVIMALLARGLKVINEEQDTVQTPFNDGIGKESNERGSNMAKTAANGQTQHALRLHTTLPGRSSCFTLTLGSIC
jgi:hypothetical protein